jgi:MFS family permease
MFTLLLMGVSTFLIGCLPSYGAIGWGAPALLIVCRVRQGLSAAGEQAGASSLTLEHAPDDRRSFFTSWTLTGTQGGQILAALVFIPIVAMSDDFKFTIGWRIPFWASAIVVLVAYVIRRSLDETPEFEEARANGEIVKLPIAVLLRDHWADVLRSSAAPSSPASPRSSATSRSPTAWRWASASRSRCGWSSWPTCSHCSPSRCSGCSPTGSAASPCSSTARCPALH